MAFLFFARLAILSFSVLLSLTVLALSLDLIYVHQKMNQYGDNYGDAGSSGMSGSNGGGDDGPDRSSALCAAVAILSVAATLPMLIVDLLKRKSFISMVVVEASCLCVLWILWLACGAFTIVDNDSHLLSALDCDDIPSASRCYEAKFIEVFALINWITLMIYANTLFTLGVIGHMRKQPLWFSVVREAPMLSPAEERSPESIKLLSSASSFSTDDEPTYNNHSHPHTHVHGPSSYAVQTQQAILPGGGTPSMITRGFAGRTNRRMTGSTLPPTYVEEC
ncbi:uncharacterized protein STEHIDRAFT_147925 [Stereum hirsutum FP-91666 SS1]|uniref:uncharacterized protein n=1 Tax=Stereum hirsutum (strain FP-91666) TaxID=721885 RepID=UPI0004449338|nr:uncharacterized protein STEHIDRAFT_147925 [Stereum hirsutum FP-91666 SS1]EIM85579.1 hypothetical protein STEHIDRAFT_147925 [Stereum hirsutum FP-91666 SS1]